MARSGGRSGKASEVGRGVRWLIGASALLLALLALYVLMRGGGSDAGREDFVDPIRESAQGQRRGQAGDQEALDDIDARSREAMRDLLRDAGD